MVENGPEKIRIVAEWFEFTLCRLLNPKAKLHTIQRIFSEKRIEAIVTFLYQRGVLTDQ